MELKDFLATSLNEERIKVEYVEPDKRSRTLYIVEDGINKSYIAITDMFGDNIVRFHKDGVDKVIEALQKIKDSK